MIERALFEIIQGGVTYLQETPGVITGFFKSMGLKQEEAEKVEAYFQKDTPNVVHGYARRDNDFPLYAITLGNDTPEQSFMGDEGGFIGDEEDPDHGADEYASIRALTFNILVYAQNPDVVAYLYQLLWQMLVNGIDILKGEPHFAHNIRISGADLAPDPAWVPAGLFVRRATLSCSQEYNQPRTSTKEGRAWKVAGIHVDAEGAAGEDVGGVKTQVYPVNEE